MGVADSKLASKGTLSAACAPPAVEGAMLPQLPRGEKKYRIVVSDGKKSGDEMQVSAGGKITTVKIPFVTRNGKNVVLKGGDKFYYTTKPEISKVIASTLPSIPGFECVQAKPIIWGSVSHSFRASQYNQQAMGKQVGTLMQEVHDQLLNQAIEAGCNAVLGVNFNVTNDSSGEHGNYKQVIVTAFGTPCIVMRAAAAPIVEADGVVVLESYSASAPPAYLEQAIDTNQIAHPVL